MVVTPSIIIIGPRTRRSNIEIDADPLEGSYIAAYPPMRFIAMEKAPEGVNTNHENFACNPYLQPFRQW